MTLFLLVCAPSEERRSWHRVNQTTVKTDEAPRSIGGRVMDREQIDPFVIKTLESLRERRVGTDHIDQFNPLTLWHLAFANKANWIRSYRRQPRKRRLKVGS